MSVSLGSTNIKEMYLGNTKIKEAYLGNTKIFGSEQEELGYIKIKYNNYATNIGGANPHRIEYRDINTFAIIESINSHLSSPEEYGDFKPTLYVYLSNSDNLFSDYVNDLYYPEYSYDKVEWHHFPDSQGSGIPLDYGQTLYVRSYKPICTISEQMNFKLYINSMQIDKSTIYNKTDLDNVEHQCYKCTIPKYRYNNTFYDAADLIEISGNLEDILGYDYPDYETLLDIIGPITLSDSYASFDHFFSNCKDFLYKSDKLVLPWTNINNGLDSQFANMFANCNRLKYAPKLPATTLAQSCYKAMFFNCSSLITAPELPAMKMESECYYQMFNGCTNLVQVPELPATILARACYAGMFGGCSLTTAPELPAMNMEGECYYAMFQSCPFLVKAPELHSINLADYCYGYMFQNCTSLTNPPDVLPATTINSRGCYIDMFQNCTSMTEAPDILALNIGYRLSIFTEMFIGCSSLNSIRIAYMGLFDNDFADWVSGVAASGRFFYDGIDTTPNIPTGWTKIPNYLTLEPAYDDEITTISFDWQNNVRITDLKYSYDLQTWNSIDANNYSFQLSKTDSNYNKKIYIWNSSSTLSRYGESLNIGVPSSLGINGGHYKISGNPSSLYNFGDIPFAGLSNLFSANIRIKHGYNSITALIKANIVLDNTNNTSSSTRMYEKIFEYNSKLKYPPSINERNNLYTSIYSRMFVSCSSLIMAPNLASTKLSDSCYTTMFGNCTNLKTAPELPATTLAKYCYSGMFYGCTSLTTAPELPATTLDEYCYDNMFSGCTSLTTAPELPATTLVDRCYYAMFYGCYKLKYIKILYTGNFDADETFFTSWLSGVESEGDFYYNGSDTTRGSSAIPTGWTVHTF